MGTLWNREPVAIMAVIQAGLAMAIGFGLNLTTEQMALVLTFSGAVLALITRGSVNSPTATAKAIGMALESNPGKGQVVNVAKEAEVSVPVTGTGPGTRSGGTGTGDGT